MAFYHVQWHTILDVCCYWRSGEIFQTTEVKFSIDVLFFWVLHVV